MKRNAEISLFGNVGGDPKRPSTSNPDFIKFSLAVTDNLKDSNGVKQTQTEWYEILTSQKGLADLIARYVQKGKAVYVQGTPKFSTYLAKDGTTKVQISVNLTYLKLLGGKDDDQDNGNGNSNSNGSAPVSPGVSEVTTAIASGYFDGNFDDDIPF